MNIQTIIVPIALFLGVGCTLADAMDEELAQTEEALAAVGQDFPGDDCALVDKKTGSTTYGKCEKVCKDKTVYNPSPSEDPAGTDGRCYVSLRIRTFEYGNVGSGTVLQVAP